MKQKIGILSSCAVIMSYLAISPVIADIANAFPNVNVSLVQMIITLPCLVGMVFSLITGQLTKKVYKKHLMLISLCAYLIGGLLPVLFHQNIWFLLACSSIIGIGNGGLMTLTASIICDYYTGREQNRMMGLQSAFISGGAMIFSLLGGQLSRFGWHMSYLTFLLLIPVIIVAAMCLPMGIMADEDPQTDTQPAGAAGRAGGSSIAPYVYFLVGIGFIYYLCQNAYNTNASLFVEEASLGTSATASIATTTYTFAGIFAGLLLDKVMGFLHEHSITFAIAISGIGLALVFLAQGMPLVVAGGFLCGFGFSTFTPAGNCIISDHSTVRARPMSIALFSAFTNVGSSLSPVVINALIALIGLQTVRSKFLVTAVGLLFVTILAAVGIIRAGQKQPGIHAASKAAPRQKQES